MAALQNAVREDRVLHAYLLSGPRGTGKTTAARILAKALNCTGEATDGEPCCSCDSCEAIDAGTSFDLHELDAASNNKVDDIRDLLSKVALGTPGRTKVYLLDEVHMLTAGAENALLKTLEEPPDHVVFVLATTEPHKVVETIRSRSQHLELNLLGAEDLESLVRDVVVEAGLDVDDAGVDHAVRAGRGSARDALSALDRVVAGGITDDDTSVDELLRALSERDPGRALGGLGHGNRQGPRAAGDRGSPPGSAEGGLPGVHGGSTIAAGCCRPGTRRTICRGGTSGRDHPCPRGTGHRLGGHAPISRSEG